MAKKEREMEEMDMEDVGGSRVYELGFHIDPELPSEEVKKVYQSIRSEIEKQGGLVAEGEPQMVQLAYTISRQENAGRRDFDSAQFAWIAYETSAPNHEAVLNFVKENSNIVRFIDVITTKEVARHAAEIRLLEMKAPTQGDEKEVSDAELDAAIEEVAPAAAVE